jgi:hypothetical protein
LRPKINDISFECVQSKQISGFDGALLHQYSKAIIGTESIVPVWKGDMTQCCGSDSASERLLKRMISLVVEIFMFQELVFFLEGPRASSWGLKEI